MGLHASAPGTTRSMRRSDVRLSIYGMRNSAPSSLWQTGVPRRAPRESSSDGMAIEAARAANLIIALCQPKPSMCTSSAIVLNRWNYGFSRSSSDGQNYMAIHVGTSPFSARHARERSDEQSTFVRAVNREATLRMNVNSTYARNDDGENLSGARDDGRAGDCDFGGAGR